MLGIFLAWAAIVIAKSFLGLAVLIVGAQRAVPENHGKGTARRVPTTRINFGNRSKAELSRWDSQEG
jgi:hypothetical protein